MIPETALSFLRTPSRDQVRMIRSAVSRSSLAPPAPGGLSMPAKKDSSILLQRSHSSSWAEIEDDLVVLLQGNESSLDLFHRLFQQHSRAKLPSDVLLCLACLVTYDEGESSVSKFYSFSLAKLASFLVNGKVGDEVKLACLRLIISIRSSQDPTAAWQLRDSVIQENLRFILDLEESLYLKHHSEQVFLWELRAICQCQLTRQMRASRHSKRRPEEDSHEAAKLLLTGAQRIKSRIQTSVRVFDGLSRPAIPSNEKAHTRRTDGGRG